MGHDKEVQEYMTFNSNMVRLRAFCCKTLSSKSMPFNSNMVRLRAF